MSVDAFFDTNVILYAASKDPRDRGKMEIAIRLITEINFGISLQVAQEFFHNARTQARLGISSEEGERVIDLLLKRPLIVPDVNLFHQARKTANRYKLSYWDAAIVAAAQRLKAGVLYSEDLNHGQEFDGVKLVNPFRE